MGQSDKFVYMKLANKSRAIESDWILTLPRCDHLLNSLRINNLPEHVSDFSIDEQALSGLVMSSEEQEPRILAPRSIRSFTAETACSIFDSNLVSVSTI